MRTFASTNRRLPPPAIVTLVLMMVLAALVAGASAVSAQGTVPDAPDQAIGTAVFVGGVNLEWNDVHGADSYDVQLYRNGQWIDLPGEGVEIAFYGAGAIISGLDPDSTLWFQVRAKNAHGSSDWSNFSSLPSTNQFKLGRRARPDNVPASGAPVINGTAQVGESLTADTTGIEDGNGLDRVQFRFQWVFHDGSADTDIASATDSTYTLAASDEGKTIRVRVAFTDRGGYAESMTSSATATVAAAPNSPATGAPVISGTAEGGKTLTADTSDIADADGLSGATFTYQWIANDGSADTDIQDATDSTYTLVADDEGKTVKVRVSFTDDVAHEETLTSAATATVGAAPNNPATGTLSISGTAEVGETLAADTTDIADADGLNGVTFGYQWVANDGTADTDIADATASTYTLVSADEGRTIKVRVSFTDDDGYEETLTSTATEAVSYATQQQTSNSPATGSPTITGTAQVGSTLTADTSDIADADGLNGVTFGYQWVANDGTADTDIADATASTYTLVSADEGKTIKVRVSFTDDAANEESLTSAATGAVVAAPSSYITVAVTEDSSDPDNIVTNFTVTWSDSDDCSTNYNIYLAVWTGPGVGQTTRTHIGSAASGSTQATLPIPYSGGNSFIAPRVKVELYCGEYAEDSSQNDLVASTGLSMQYSDLRSGTFSSAPLTALSVGSRTLSPSFNRGKIRYGVDVPSDERRVTLSPTALTGYEFVYVRNPIWGVVMGCDVRGCHYSYGDGTTTGIVLADVDPNTSGFQVDLDGGENQLGIGVNKGDEDAGPGSLYYLTVTVENVPATGRPTVSGTTQVGQTLTADTSGISDEDGLDDVNFSYQWIRVNSDSTETDIAGATRYTYTLASADADKTIKVRVTFADDAGNEESLTSASTSAVTQVAALSTDATLRALTLSGVNFGTFESATTSYTARVSNTVPETTVAPTLNHSGASYVTKLGGVTDADGVISLSEGSNVITVEVTAEDGQTAKTYTITVTRLDSQSDPISSDASLSELTLSGINFGTFASGTTSYSITVANSVSQTTVAPTVNHSEASHVIKLGGVTDADGTVSLAVGSNVITVEVTAEDTSTTRTYTVTVTRADPPSTDATLKALTVNGINMGGGRGPYYWVGYLIDVNYSVTEATVTPTVNHSGASYVIKLNGVVDEDGALPLAVGRNRITIEVTAEDGETTKTYSVSVKRRAVSTDARLRALTLSGIDFGTFVLSTTAYTAEVTNSPTETTVTPTVNDSGASYVIKLGGVEDDDGTVSLEAGSNVITVEVTAEDGQTTRTYTIAVTRLVTSEVNLASTDATLSGLTLSGIDFGTFASGTNSYSAQVANSVQQTTVTSTVNHSGASYVIKLGGVEDADGTVSLTVGSNTIAIEVTAEDDSTTKSYTVTVTRVPNTPATGAPTISSTAEVGQTLTARTSGISDDDGLDNATYAYQWIRTEGTTDTDIAGATETTYLVTTDDVDRALGVRISFTDDAGNQESLTSAATAEVETPLTAELQNVPEIHNGEDAFTFRVLFSEPVTADYQALREDSFDISNGTIKRARWVNGRNDLSQFTVQPSSNNDVVMVLPADRSCDAEGAICTSDGKRLSNRLELTVPGLVPANSPAVGLPTISGMAQVGDTLMADTSGIADADGLINVTYSYQWVVNDGTTDTDIQDATGFTFTPVDAYEGKTIKVRVSFTDDAGNGESLTSAATVSVAARPNTPATGAPTPDAPDQPIATAVFVAGVDLEWNDVPGADSYDVQLYRNGQWIDLPGGGVEIAFYGEGAIISGLDPNSTLWFQVRAKNARGSSDWSNFSSVASTSQFKLGRRARPDNVPASGAPVIDGTAQVGEILTADTTGIEDGNGLDRVQFRYQWVSSDGTTDTDIQSATESTYTLKTADTDRTVSARVAFTDRGGYAESLTGTATEQVAPSAHANPAPTPEPAQNSPATGSPAVTGTAQVGETLSADISRIGDADGLANVSYSYQWVRNDGTSDTDITDAAESSYTLVAADDGKTIKVRVSFTDDEANEETLISTATEAVSFAVQQQIVNSSATGAPTIGGTAQVGETLTVDTSDIADDDGLNNVTYGHQWIANDGSSYTDIADATESTYTLLAADEGKTIKVRVSFTDDAGDGESLTSTATATVTARPNTPAAGALIISGTAEVGETLSADTSGIVDTDGLNNVSFSYQWIRNDGNSDTDITSETESTYILVSADEGKTIKVRVTFTDDAGDGESLTSTATATVTARPNTPATGAPIISGTAQVGETLTADTSGIVDTDGLDGVTFSYQWVANDGTADTDIAGETDSTYTLVSADEGKTIKVRVSFTDDVDHEETLTSAATATVGAAPNNPATGTLSISGTAEVGETLTADTSDIADADGLNGVTFSYQWIANDATSDTDIAGETDSTYTLVSADEGRTIKVRVSFTDDAANEETLTSAATSEVVAAAPTDPPGRPHNLTGAANADGTVTLSWDAPNDDSVTGYQILRRRPREGGEHPAGPRE